MPKLTNPKLAQRAKRSDVSARLNLAVAPAQKEAFQKMQELLALANEGRRLSASIIVQRMMNLYSAHLSKVFIEVAKKVEAGELKESERRDAIIEGLKPEIAALLRAGGHRVREV